MLTFALAVFLLIVTPGPGVLSIAGVGAAYGFRAGFSYLTGLFIGTNLVALAVISGLAAAVLGVPVIRIVLMVASIAYLLYLAAKIAFAGTKLAFIEARTAPGIGAGLALQAINPKAYAVNTAFFSGFPIYPDNFPAEVVAKLIVSNLIWLPIHFGWLWAGVVLHRLNLPQATQHRINYLMAAAMLGVVLLAILAATRT